MQLLYTKALYWKRQYETSSAVSVPAHFQVNLNSVEMEKSYQKLQKEK